MFLVYCLLQPNEMCGVIELFALLEIKSELWDNKPASEREGSHKDDSSSESRTSEQHFPREKITCDDSELSDEDNKMEAAPRSVSACGGAASGGSEGEIVVKTETTDAESDHGSSHTSSHTSHASSHPSHRRTIRRRRRRSSSIPVNLSLSNTNKSEDKEDSISNKVSYLFNTLKPR